MVSNLLLGSNKYFQLDHGNYCLDMGIKFIRSRGRKGGIKLVDSQGYVFAKEKVNKEKTYWKCIQAKNKCKGRITTIDSKIVTPMGSLERDPLEHNHLPPEN